jgi:hypothetical protein
MENIIELNPSELKEISGGVNPAYEIGYAIGSFVKNILLFRSIESLFR